MKRVSRVISMSALGQKRTFCAGSIYVCFTPESGHFTTAPNCYEPEVESWSKIDNIPLPTSHLGDFG